MIYIVGLRTLRDSREFTSVHVEADNIQDAITVAETHVREKYDFGLYACSVKESFVEVIRKKA